jgi:hypothetical protein
MTFTDSNLTPATSYCYRIGAFNDCGERYSVAPICAQTDPPPPPFAPSSLTVTDRTMTSIQLP